MDFESLELDDEDDLVLATSDQPAFKLHPGNIQARQCSKKQEKLFIKQTNKEFKQQIHQVEAELGEENDWNAVLNLIKKAPTALSPSTAYRLRCCYELTTTTMVKPMEYQYSSKTIKGDLNPDPFIIDDPLGLSELAAAPKLVVDSSSKLDGSAALRVEGVPGTGLWLKLKAIQTNAILQNSLELINDSGDSLGSIGGTAKSKDLGKKLIYVAAGETLSFKQASGGQKDIHSPLIKIKESKGRQSTDIINDNSSDRDFDDLLSQSNPNISSPAMSLKSSKQHGTNQHPLEASWTSAKSILTIDSKDKIQNSITQHQ